MLLFFLLAPFIAAYAAEAKSPDEPSAPSKNFLDRHMLTNSIRAMTRFPTLLCPITRGGRSPAAYLLMAGLALIGWHGATAAEAFQAPTAEAVLKTLKQEHPRLIISPKIMDETKALIARDAVAARIYASILKSADKALEEKPSVYELPDGRRLLTVSQKVRRRVENLAFAYLMTGDKKYVNRAWIELEAASKFKDWNPNHFLDTAVMTYAFALGYDWLYQEWTPQQRATLKQAIVNLGMKPAMEVYKGGNGWAARDNNWNQVCNGGIGLGALAIADEEPVLAAAILSHALASIPRAMSFYAPDGGGEEGLSYWDFGSSYNVLLMAGLESALGTDFGLSQVDGFRQSGDYQIFLCGTGRIPFDFGDCNTEPASTAQHFWMARKYDVPRYAWFRYSALVEGQSGGIMDLLWWNPITKPPAAQDMPLDRVFRKVECGSLRDGWEPAKGFTVGLEGGRNNGHHRHLDLGSFILECDGVRWIRDSGKEKETYHTDQNHQERWDFYRTRAEGHNTLVFNPDMNPDQSPVGSAAFTPIRSEAARATTSLDLTKAYADNATKVIRTFTLDRGRSFSVVDEITCKHPSTVWSFFHTEAKVEIAGDKRSATLTDHGKKLTVRLLAPDGATLTAMPAEPLPSSPQIKKQAENNKFSKLAVRLEGITSTRIEVQFVRYASVLEQQE